MTWRLALVVLLPRLAVPAPGPEQPGPAAGAVSSAYAEAVERYASGAPRRAERRRRAWLSAASGPANGAIVAGA